MADFDWGQNYQGGNVVSGEGGQVPTSSVVSSGEGGSGGGFKLGPDPEPEPAPRVPVLRAAKNVQRANIDRSSLYDPTQATQSLGADYLQQRNASNPQPLGSTGAGAVGYDFTPSNERLY